MKSPIVFVSHASEDKKFVLQLAERLRSDGVDAWVDQWEIAVGDSLVDKIFSEGIGKCDAFLIVLSSVSIAKPWVREELNSGVIEAIERSAKLLPIKIDNCEVPVVLKSRKWLSMKPEAFDAEYAELLGSIFGKQNKPPLGSIPAIVFQQLVGYSIIESRILRFIVQMAAESSGDGNIDASTVTKALGGVDGNALRGAIEMLESDGNLKVTWCLGGNFFASLTPKAWIEFGSKIIGFNANEDLKTILSMVASIGACNSDTLMQKTGLPAVRIVFGVKYLKQIGYLSVVQVLGGPLAGLAHIECTPQGRRQARL
jgi:hypothetical protein